MSKQIALKENYSLDKIKDMTAMAIILKSHVVGHKLYTPIKGKNYVHIEGWQFAGGLIGLYPRVTGVVNLSDDKEKKWQANVEIIDRKTGAVVGNGFALCSSKEGAGTKSSKEKNDEYAILSMAQTRAIGKAYRNLIGWVMKLAGYEATPSEEMRKVYQVPQEPIINAGGAESESTEDVKLKQGQVIGPDGKPTYVCSVCKDPINDQVSDFSLKVYKKRLCREHQPKKK